METNCTAYIDNEPVRGFVEYTVGCGQVGLEYPHDDGERTIERPYPPYLIVLDDDVLFINQIVQGYDGDPDTIEEIPRDQFDWNDPTIICKCGSHGCSESYGAYYCHVCDGYFYEKK